MIMLMFSACGGVDVQAEVGKDVYIVNLSLNIFRSEKIVESKVKKHVQSLG